MRDIITKSRFRRDYKKVSKRGLDLNLIDAIILEIAEDGNAASQYSPHKLSGDWSGYWECHIAPDWLLIYTVDDEAVTLVRTGSHSDLF